MDELIEAKLRELLALMLRDKPKDDAPREAALNPTSSTDQRCVHCGAAIRWVRTAANGKKAALEARPGPYVINADGEAEFVGGTRGNFSYHYGDPSCPGTPKPLYPSERGQQEHVSTSPAFDSLMRDLDLPLPAQ